MNTPTLPLLTLFTALSLVGAACGGSTATDVDLPAVGDDGTDQIDLDDTGGDGALDDDGVVAADDLPLGGGSYAIGTLKIDIEHPELDTVSYELACFGDTATLIPDPTDGVRADAACTALARPDIEQYLVNGPADDQVCTEIFGGPDTARIVGMLSGNDIDITIDRSNGCGIDAWDVLLADVLPQASGEI